MARIFKISGYLVDAIDDYDAKQLEVALKEDYDLIAHHIRVEERDIGEWDDDCPINYFDCPKEECEKYFDHHADVAPKSEVARDIFEEIEKLLHIGIVEHANCLDAYVKKGYAELKKKYTGEQI